MIDRSRGADAASGEGQVAGLLRRVRTLELVARKNADGLLAGTTPPPSGDGA